MKNKKLAIIIGIILIAIGAKSLFNSTYISIIGGDEPTSMFLSIVPDTQSLIIISIAFILGIIFLSKGCVRKFRDK